MRAVLARAARHGATRQDRAPRGKGQIVREHEELFTGVGWLQVLAGQGIEPTGWHPLADAIPAQDLAEFLKTITALYRREVSRWSSHAEVIARDFAARAAAAATG